MLKIIPRDQAFAIDARRVLMTASALILTLKMGLMTAYQAGAFGVEGETNEDAEARVNAMEAAVVPC